MECYEACPLNDCWAKCSWFICDVSVVVWIYKWSMWSRMKCCYIEVSSWQIFVWCGVFDKQIFIRGLMVVHEMMVANIKSWRIDFENGFLLEGTWPKMEIIWSLLALLYSYEISIRLVLFWAPKRRSIKIMFVFTF
jgi:hypothetical protein